MLSTEGQIAHLKTRGVALELCDEQEALEYLRANTYYYKLAAYRVLFPKKVGGPMTGSCAIRFSGVPRTAKIVL